jgi:hypothetical protein
MFLCVFCAVGGQKGGGDQLSSLIRLKTIFLSKTSVKDGCFDKSGFSKIDFCCINAKLCNQVRSLDHFVVQNFGDFLC